MVDPTGKGVLLTATYGPIDQFRLEFMLRTFALAYEQ